MTSILDLNGFQYPNNMGNFFMLLSGDHKNFLWGLGGYLNLK